MNERKYPLSLFVAGFLMNMITHFFVLFALAIIFIIVGFFVGLCTEVGLILLLLDVVLSLVEQLKIRRTILEDSDDPNFREFQDIFAKDGNWKDNVIESVNERIKKLNDKEN